MDSLQEFNGIWFEPNTDAVLRDVILDCIKNSRYVHILTGSPLTGIITPTVLSMGFMCCSKGTKPVPVLKVPYNFSDDGEFTPTDGEKARIMRVKSSRVLKIADAKTGELLFQAYECHCSSLKIIKETTISPFGDITSTSKIVCSNPSIEIPVHESTNAVELCEFMMGKRHNLTAVEHLLDRMPLDV